MHVTAKVDYAVRAAVELAAAGEGPVKGDAIAAAQDIPLRFLGNILGELRSAGILRSQRGAEGGYWLARPADEVTIAEVIRAVEGPIASIRSARPDEVTFPGAAAPLREVWIALRANMRAVLEKVTLADVVAGKLPGEVLTLTEPPEVWQAH